MSVTSCPTLLLIPGITWVPFPRDQQVTVGLDCSQYPYGDFLSFYMQTVRGVAGPNTNSTKTRVKSVCRFGNVRAALKFGIA